jgi:hypothetical protein
LFKLNQAQELVFVLALQNSTHIELQTSAREHIQKRLTEFIQTIIEDNDGLRDTGLVDLPIEVLHSLLVQIEQYVSTDSMTVKPEQFEQLLNLLRKGFNNYFLVFIELISFYRISTRTNRQ